MSWDDAFAEAEGAAARPRSPRRAGVTVYVGNPVAHNLALETYIGALMGFAGAAGCRLTTHRAPSTSGR